MSDEKPPFDTVVFVLLIIGTLFVPLLGLIVGGLNLKYPERNGQSGILIALGIVSIIGSWAMFMG